MWFYTIHLVFVDLEREEPPNNMLYLLTNPVKGLFCPNLADFFVCVVCTTGPQNVPLKGFVQGPFWEALICTFDNQRATLVDLFFSQSHASK